MTFKPIGLLVSTALLLQASLLPQSMFAGNLNNTSVAGADVPSIAQASNTVESGQLFSAQNSSVQIAMGSGCSTKRTKHHHRMHMSRKRSTAPAITSSSSSTTERREPQVIRSEVKSNPATIPTANNCCEPATTCTQTLVEPACVDRVVAQPVVVEHHHSILPLLIGGALLATAIAVPLAVALPHHHHHNNYNAVYAQQLLLTNPTP